MIFELSANIATPATSATMDAATVSLELQLFEFVCQLINRH
jgi:hypothetical protein